METSALKTRVFRDKDGWHAQSEIAIGHDLVLWFRTGKTSQKALVSRLQVKRIEGDFIVFKMFQDFSRDLEYNPVSRVTEGVVRSQHDHVLKNLEDFIVQALTFYGHPATEATAIMAKVYPTKTAGDKHVPD